MLEAQIAFMYVAMFSLLMFTGALSYIMVSGQLEHNRDKKYYRKNDAMRYRY